MKESLRYIKETCAGDFPSTPTPVSNHSIFIHSNDEENERTYTVEVLNCRTKHKEVHKGLTRSECVELFNFDPEDHENNFHKG